MNLPVTFLADNQGFALACCHSLYPQRFFSLSWFIQVCELAYVMDFAFVR